MRKFTQPACIVLGVLSLLLTSVRGKETELQSLDAELSWKITKGGGRFVAVAKAGRGGYAASSLNGADWQVEKLIVGFNTVAHGAGKFVAVGNDGAVGITTNGLNWRIISITTNELCGVGFTGGCFVATGCPPLREIFTSRDAIVWRHHPLESNEPLAKFLETWVTVTNRAAEAIPGSVGDELRALCRAKDLELRGK